MVNGLAGIISCKSTRNMEQSTDTRGMMIMHIESVW